MLFTNWRPPSHCLAGRRFGRPQRRRPTLATRLSLEFLEDRALPSVNPIQGFAGLAFDQSVPADLPDTILAVGPTQVVEATNRDIAFFDKAGTQLLSEHLKAFWAPVLPNNLPVPGDIITAIDGHAMQSVDDVATTLANLHPGSTAKVRIRTSAGKAETLPVTLGQ